MSDTYLESAVVLKAALDLVIHGTPIVGKELNMTIRLIRFLTKWKMTRELAFVRLQLSEGLAMGHSPWEVFVGAAWLEEHDLCARAIHKAGAWSWTNQVQASYNFQIRRGGVSRSSL